MNITLNEKQTQNLLAFLARVNLTGAEVGAFQEITNLIGQAMKTEAPKEEKKK